MGHDTFQVGDLTAVIGDNDKYEGQAQGYNGVHRLTHRTEATTLFVPTVSGLNLEHYFDGEQGLQGKGNNEIFFEPRRAPMTFTKVSDQEAELHQPPTPTFQMESWTRFKLVAPHYIDFTFRFKPHQHVFKHGYVGVFWASYINAPDDRSIYFRGGKTWQQYCSQAHDLNSTVVHKDDSFQLTFSPDTRSALFKQLSPLRYDDPFYYGHFKNHVFILMFDRTEGIRFSHSPVGGGRNAALETHNPAWDWQFILPKYEVLKEYGFRARAVYREKCSRAEVAKEFEAWRASLSK